MSHNTHMYVYPAGLYNKIKEISTGIFGHFVPKFYFNDVHLKDRIIKPLNIVGTSHILVIGIVL